jgi:serine-type D-Ala-D-Ala carboxypeptidase/endopeptidase
MQQVQRLRGSLGKIVAAAALAYLALAGVFACSIQTSSTRRNLGTRARAVAVAPVLTRALDEKLAERVSARIVAALPPRRLREPQSIGEREPRAAAVVVNLQVRGRDALFAFGELSDHIKQRPDGATRFKVCSVTKAFTGVLLADAVLAGRIRLDDPVQSLLPAVKLPSHPTGPIRVEHLAEYTSGFPWMPTNFANKAQGGYSDAAWHEFLSSYVLTQAPGSTYQYGNVGYALLGDALAFQASMPLQNLYHTCIWEPLGMTRSRFFDAYPDARPDSRPDEHNRAQGLDANGHAVPLDADEPSQPASCAIETTADDLMRFLTAGLEPGRHGRVGQAIAYATAERPQALGELAKQKIGLGFFRSADAHLAWKDGAIGGYRSAIGLDPSAQIAIVVLAADERVDATGLMFALVKDARRCADGAKIHEEQSAASSFVRSAKPITSPRPRARGLS